MMKNTQYINKLLFLVAGILLLSSCYDEDNFLDDNLTLTGRDFPVIADFEISESSYAVGESAEAILSYWSEGTIKEIKLYATVGADPQVLVSTTPYSPNLVDSLRTDVLVLNYSVPSVASGTSIDLEVEVVNENGLSKFEDDGFDVE